MPDPESFPKYETFTVRFPAALVADLKRLANECGSTPEQFISESAEVEVAHRRHLTIAMFRGGKS